MLFSSVGIQQHCFSRGFPQYSGICVKRPRVALVPSRAQPCSPSDLPPELQGVSVRVLCRKKSRSLVDGDFIRQDCQRAGLTLNDEGLLVDEKTGEVINEYGATRFDVAVRGEGQRLQEV